MAAAAETLAAPRDRIWDEISEMGLKSTSRIWTTTASAHFRGDRQSQQSRRTDARCAGGSRGEAQRRASRSRDRRDACLSTQVPVRREERAVRPVQLKDQTPALKSPADLGKEDSPFGDRMHSIFYEDPVFAEALMNPPMLAMVTYLLGYSAVLSNMGCWMKGPCKSNFPLHTDCGGMPSPLPQQAYAAQCTYLLTDFNRENGATCLVPGSHRWNRNPIGDEKTLLPLRRGRQRASRRLRRPGGLYRHLARQRLARRVQSHGARDSRQRDGLLQPAVHASPGGLHRQDPREDVRGDARQVWAAGCDGAAARVRSGYSTQGDRVSYTARADQYIDAYEQAAGVKTRNKSDPYH